MKMKNCELCKGLARMRCESDRASLCWSCDYKVHSANFLVARHSRTLLCHVCQSPTPWTAAGLKLGPTVSVCDGCVQNYNKINAGEETEAANEGGDIQTDMVSDNLEDDEEEDDEDEEYDDEEDTDCEDNQVVPWSPSTPPPPSAANSPSNSDEESYSSSSISSPCDRREAQRKRTRENADRCYNVNYVSTSSQGNAYIPPATVEVTAAAKADGYGAGEGRVDMVDSLSTITEKSLKKRRTGTGGAGKPGSRSWAVVESVNRLHKQEMRSSAAIAKLCRLSDDPSAFDCDSSGSSQPSL